MDGIIALLAAFPTVVFATLAALSLGYWVLVLLGAADLDALDGVTGHADGAVKGALEGAVDAVAGAAKGATALGEALGALGLHRVPFTVTLSLFSLFGFFLSVSTRHLLDPVLPDVVSALVASVVATVGAGAVTTAAVRPLARLFDEGRAERGGDALVGRTCRITIDADEHGGQARIDENVIVPVRAIGMRIGRHEEAVILERGEDGVFIVEPVKALVPTEQDAFARLGVEARPSSRDDVVTAAPATKKDQET